MFGTFLSIFTKATSISRRASVPPRRRAGPGPARWRDQRSQRPGRSRSCPSYGRAGGDDRGRLVSGRGAVRPTRACCERSRSRDRGGLRPHSRGSGGDPHGRTRRSRAPSRQGSCRVRVRRRPGSGKAAHHGLGRHPPRRRRRAHFRQPYGDEDPLAIIREVWTGCDGSAQLIVEPDRRLTIATALHRGAGGVGRGSLSPARDTRRSKRSGTALWRSTTAPVIVEELAGK